MLASSHNLNEVKCLPKTVPEQSDTALYLTEGGPETGIMYKFGYELPHFAMFTLLYNPGALSGMHERYLEVTAENGFVPLMGGLDYRAGPDWGTSPGYPEASLDEIRARWHASSHARNSTSRLHMKWGLDTSA